MKKICPACNNWYETKRDGQSFCSTSCWIDSRVWFDSRSDWYEAQGLNADTEYHSLDESEDDNE